MPQQYNNYNTYNNPHNSQKKISAARKLGNHLGIVGIGLIVMAILNILDILQLPAILGVTGGLLCQMLFPNFWRGTDIENT